MPTGFMVGSGEPIYKRTHFTGPIRTAAMALTQQHRQLKLMTPLGDDKLLLTGFTGQEEMSHLFRFHLDLLSEDNAIKAADIVGKNVTFSITLADGSQRFFNGFVCRFAAGDEADGRRRYRAEVVPWLWFLTQTANCRLFQNKKIPDIIQQVFSDRGFSDFELSMKLDHKKWEYCVQYRESDFNFVTRLMEQEGIFYFFKHDNGKHQLVLADHKGAYVDCVENEVDYPPTVGQKMFKDHLTGWEQQFDFCTGKWAQTDYNFETPTTSLLTKSSSVVSLPGIDGFEVFDYPGTYRQKSEGDVESKVRMEEIEVAHNIVHASSGCRSFFPGGKFKVGMHRSSSEEGKPYVITMVRHEAREPLAYETGGLADGPDYNNVLRCIPDAVVFRPSRTTTKPVVHGIQTAVVVGPPGEEIHTDKYGRVRVHFHWDREHSTEEDSSCWMRVSHAHAGSGFGAIYIPRVDEEVVVAFLEGDPDQPLIVGRVYNANKMSAFGLPDAKVICGMKSKTYKGGGYNEYVMDDSPGKELIREHGQFDKDSTIENDLREHVLNCRSRDVGVDETISIGSNRTETVGADESLTVAANRTESVGANETLSVGGSRTRNVGGSETVTVAVARTHTVGANEAITVGAAQEITVGGMQAISVGAIQEISVGALQNIDVGASQSTSVGSNRSADIGGNDTIKAGKKFVVEAGSEITLKTGGASITMKKDGTITIKGKDITLKASGKIAVKASSNVTIKGSKILEN